MNYVLLVFTVALSLVLAGWLWWRSRPAQRIDRTWFRLLAVPGEFWSPRSSEPVRVDTSTLLAGLHLPLAPLSSSDAHPLRVHTSRVFSQHSVRGQFVETFIGVPPEFASNVPFAAAGCGLMALPVPAPAGAIQGSRNTVSGGRHSESLDTSAGLPGFLEVAPAPGFFLGLSESGQAVGVNLVPGATVALRGPEGRLKALLQENHEALLATAEGDFALVTVLPVAADDGQDAVRSWRQNWNQQQARLLLLGADTALPDGIIADVVISLAADGSGTVMHGEARRYFRTPMHLLPRPAVDSPAAGALPHGQPVSHADSHSAERPHNPAIPQFIS